MDSKYKLSRLYEKKKNVFLLQNHAVLLCLTSPRVVLQKQFLSGPLDAPQHIETVSQASGKGHVVGQGHGEVIEWQ